MVLNILLLVVVVLQEILHYCERQDLYNRIMSKDLKEYKQGNTLPKSVPSAHERTLNKWRNKAGDE